jgi:hypothetical protein
MQKKDGKRLKIAKQYKAVLHAAATKQGTVAAGMIIRLS